MTISIAAAAIFYFTNIFAKNRQDLIFWVHSIYNISQISCNITLKYYSENIPVDLGYIINILYTVNK